METPLLDAYIRDIEIKVSREKNPENRRRLESRLRECKVWKERLNVRRPEVQPPTA